MHIAAIGCNGDGPTALYGPSSDALLHSGVMTLRRALVFTISGAFLALGHVSSAQEDPSDTGRRNADLIHACRGYAVDFVTGRCVKPGGQQVNPRNLWPDFQAPLPKPDPGDLIVRCRGRGVDFVTGKCL